VIIYFVIYSLNMQINRWMEVEIWKTNKKMLYVYTFIARMTASVVYKFRGPGFDSRRGPLSLMLQLRSYLEEIVAAPV
jgi:hypothetical protein